MFEVMSRRCDQCLLSPERIVSGARAAQLIRKCAKEDASFLCHKGTMAGRDIACRGHYETGVGQMARIAGRLGMVREVDPDTLAPAQGIDARQGHDPKGHGAQHGGRDD